MTQERGIGKWSAPVAPWGAPAPARDPDAEVAVAPVVLTEIDEKEASFALFVAQGDDPVAACIRAGLQNFQYHPEVWVRQILERPEIVHAIETLREAAKRQQTIAVTRQSVVADMQDIFQKAMEVGDFKEAIASKKLQAGLLGLLVEKKEVVVRRGVDEMSDDELARIAGEGHVVDAEFEEVDEGEEGP